MYLYIFLDQFYTWIYKYMYIIFVNLLQQQAELINQR